MATSQFDFGDVADLTVGLNDDSNTFGLDVSFGWTLSQYIEEDILLIKCARGGSDLAVAWQSPSAAAALPSIDYGFPDEPIPIESYGELWRYFIRMWQDVEQNPSHYIPGATSFEVAGIIWWQGWNDAFGPASMRSNYESNLRYLIEDLQSNFGKNVPILIGELGQDAQNEEGDYVQVIQDAQQQVANEFDMVQFIPTSPYVYPSKTKYDGVHHYYGRADTFLEIGTAFALSFIGDDQTRLPTTSPTLSFAPTVSASPSLSSRPTRIPSQAPSMTMVSRDEFCNPSSLIELETKLTEDFEYWYEVTYIYPFSCICNDDSGIFSVACTAAYFDDETTYLYRESVEFDSEGLANKLTWCEYNDSDPTGHCESYEYCNYGTSHRDLCACSATLCSSCQICASDKTKVGIDCSGNEWDSSRYDYKTTCGDTSYDGGMAMMYYDFPEIVVEREFLNVGKSSEPPSSMPSSLTSTVPSGGSAVLGKEVDDSLLGPFCFSGSSTVQVLGQEEPIPLSSLRVGQYVLVQGGVYSQVYAFGHYDTEVIVNHYLAIRTTITEEASELVVSPDHLLLLQSGHATAAAHIQIGDVLWNGAAVTNVQYSVREQGAYAPFTWDGTIVVNGMVASSYIQVFSLRVVDPHFLAHVGVTPLRWYCRFVANDCRPITEMLPQYWRHCRWLVLIFFPIVILLFGIEQVW
eukprot:CAMPEP_0194264284 /NCGR_PEP_ID=MMETSP0158-20130606/47504_1 /TAXON_ID=33649 /ORGANISM="Thalassionema nitzschioides, Strain L26-B" /LENGTH=689 /DNA_ID=CAMNT_0039004519 /DNA_START=338 /DNA_END=2404 /DNA_ORIENTATION=+